MKRMTDDVKWIVYGGQKQIKRLPWLDLEKIRIDAVTEDVEDIINELDLQVQVEAEAVEVKIESDSATNRKSRRKRKGRRKRLPSVVSREVQTEEPAEEAEAEEAAPPEVAAMPPPTPDLSALLLPELPKTPNCAWVHPGCKVELRGVPIHEVMRTKTTLQCWCGERPMIEITTQTCLLADEQNAWMGQAQGQELCARTLPNLTVGRQQDGGGNNGERRRCLQEGEWAAGNVRLPPITPTNTPHTSVEENSRALSRTSLLSLCTQASACSTVKCAERRPWGANVNAHSRDYVSPMSATSSIPLTPLLPLDSLSDDGALPGARWQLETSPLPHPQGFPPRTPSF